MQVQQCDGIIFDLKKWTKQLFIDHQKSNAMFTKNRIYITVIISALILLTSCAAGYVTDRPVDVVYERGLAPGPGYIWISGDWYWSGGRYMWREGHWAPPRAGRTWNAGRWESSGKGWRWRKGHW